MEMDRKHPSQSNMCSKSNLKLIFQQLFKAKFQATFLDQCWQLNIKNLNL